MIQPKFTNKKLLEVAKENYEKLVRFCAVLDGEGYWQEPEKYLHKSIYEILDLYLHSMMMHLAVYCGNNGLVQRRFMMETTDTNPFSLPDEGELSNDTLLQVQRMLRTPPIVLQLCGVRDGKEESFFSSYFFDAVLSILLSFSLLEQKQSKFVDKFITEYYEKNANFINQDQRETVVNARYLFLKLSSERYFDETAPVQNLKYTREEQKRLREQKRKEQEALRKEKQKGRTDTVEEVELQEQVESEQADTAEEVELQEQVESEQADTVEEVEPQEQVESEQADTVEEVAQKEEKVEPQKFHLKQELHEKQKRHKKIKIEKNKKRSIFEYSDEELMALQREGKLKIRTPKMDQMKKEQEEAKRKFEEERVEQIRKEIEKINQATELQKLLEELNQLVGLEEVKQEISSLINLIKVKKMRESYQMPTMDVSYHMVFTGNPGTGKTTVARLVAQIYKELGVLSQGQLIEVDRAGLVAGYVGQTAMKVKEVVEKAKGGILFIDEAYTLSNKNDSNDFGGEAIDTLVKMMEDYREDLVIIVAGYKEEMEEFLKTNTGLISRFNKFIDFADYTNEEMLQILQVFMERAGLEMEEEAKQALRVWLEAMTPEHRILYGNGRGIRNTFESIVGKQANRIVNIALPSAEELKMLTLEDVKQTLQ